MTRMVSSNFLISREHRDAREACRARPAPLSFMSPLANKVIVLEDPWTCLNVQKTDSETRNHVAHPIVSESRIDGLNLRAPISVPCNVFKLSFSWLSNRIVYFFFVFPRIFLHPFRIVTSRILGWHGASCLGWWFFQYGHSDRSIGHVSSTHSTHTQSYIPGASSFYLTY